MNIFTAAVTGFTIVVKKVGIVFKAVLTGIRILITHIIIFVVRAIEAIVDAFLSFLKLVWTQIVKVVNWLFRMYLSESGIVSLAQESVSFAIRLRWGVVIISGLYAIYKYFGVTYLLLAVVVCCALILIGYSEAKKEEEKWNSIIDRINEVIARYSRYTIRCAILLFSAYILYMQIPLKGYNSQTIMEKYIDQQRTENAIQP
ncbi:MAG: hypothetical protein CDV28_10491 [Candidatus Electronema aureum]|uniref:Uncharacterized protein n=1 Tax=Candidatus Electronema aureum TaxID=2005002 RepID=A0A521G400_9BACT|nr:MAG: hypothetical protein CDV28_10491 [Candidatus Electronema aureum]